ncbi:class I SAM-dependent methyltransferase [Ruania zhangjianzhongii]|uniref:class I SAM-dependent methyltransferase n=1 Tax=Ruania zhangjianzhongii TaxID=2603206 RepID=UPI001F3B6638|nr:class I SAM-dependent methyltransferase [Ruania zhangjianzhongii]
MSHTDEDDHSRDQYNGDHQHSHQHADMAMDPAEFWEERYAGAEPVWSGRVNTQLATVAVDLPPGRALDLGCGEGADTIWLAERGWQTTGVDIAGTALQRAARAASERGLDPALVRWLQADLAAWVPDGHYDLVSASFMQSPLDFPRVEVLRRAAGAVATGGHLLIVAHAAPPPWAKGLDPGTHHFLSPAQEVAELALAEQDYTVLLAEERTRAATGPDGEQAELTDTVVLVRRH